MEQSQSSLENLIGYSLEQIRESCYGYDKLCEVFFNMAPDEETRKTLKEILYEGRVGEYYIGTTIYIRDNPTIEGKRRIGMANILITNPETFNYIVGNGIDLFHGTNANALPSIIKGGLNSVKKSVEDGIAVITGEEWSRGDKLRNFVNLTDVIDIARGYSGLSRKGGTELMSFPILFCMRTEDIKKCGVCPPIMSDLPEIGVKDNIPLDKIAAICVAPDKVEIVEKIVGDLGIKVLALNNFEDRIYYIDDYGMIEIIEENINKSNAKQDKKFSLKEIKNLVIKRKFSDIIKYLKTDEKQVGDLNHGR